MRRRRLRGIAEALIGAFVSRNNDVDGYWAPGKLYRLAETNGRSRVTVDLLARCVDPAADGYTLMLSDYAARLERYLVADQFVLAEMQGAVVALEFGLPLTGFLVLEQDGRGAGCLITVTLTDDLGHHHRAQRRCRVAPHDPRLDHRSVGRNNWQS